MPVAAQTQEQRANTCLNYIQVFAEARDLNCSLLRNTAEGWFCHTTQGPFITKTGRPKWLNKPFANGNDAMVRQCHYISREAEIVVDRGIPSGDIIIDHAIPLAVLRVRLWDLDDKSPTSIAHLLRQEYKLGVITREEDSRLTKMNLRSKLPDNAKPEDALARYSAAGIVMKCQRKDAP
ncbi:MAG: hypothetical protein P8P99_01335 [Maricaulis sp.]|nr:hypothetical protein [Maricaulis sp.]